jgi:hypothetical protein
MYSNYFAICQYGCQRPMKNQMLSEDYGTHENSKYSLSFLTEPVQMLTAKKSIPCLKAPRHIVMINCPFLCATKNICKHVTFQKRQWRSVYSMTRSPVALVKVGQLVVNKHWAFPIMVQRKLKLARADFVVAHCLARLSSCQRLTLGVVVFHALDVEVEVQDKTRDSKKDDGHRKEGWDDGAGRHDRLPSGHALLEDGVVGRAVGPSSYVRHGDDVGQFLICEPSRQQTLTVR